MNWVDCISEAVEYIETHLNEDLSIDMIAKHVSLSPFYFQKGFSMLCGFTVGEYIRFRRLSLAASELVSTEKKIIDIALDYGYDSPDSFTKAFTRFHGITPTSVRKDRGTIRSFAPLKLKIILEGGNTMEYKIVKKEALTVVGVSRKFKYENANINVPKFWNEHFQSGGGKNVCGMYGINIDESMGNDEFEYVIADNYNPILEIPEGCETRVIPAFTWAVFPCRGKMPEAIQKVEAGIFSEWLPSCKDYQFAAGYNIEMYDDPHKYKNGTQDENYYSEVWIPIKKK